MTLRPCIECGEPCETGRCQDHQRPSAPHTRPRPEHHTNTSRWKKLSLRLRRMSPFCELCGSTERLSVDHIVRVADRPDWTYEIANLRVLCLSCNGRVANQPADPATIATIETKINNRKRRRNPGGMTPGHGGFRPSGEAKLQLESGDL